MVQNKIIFYITLVAVGLIIGIPTVKKIQQKHLERLMTVEVLNIKEKAMHCYLKNECQNDKIFLKDLIDKKYLIRGIDPRTDEYFKDDVYVKIINHNSDLYIDNKLIE